MNNKADELLWDEVNGRGGIWVPQRETADQ